MRLILATLLLLAASAPLCAAQRRAEPRLTVWSDPAHAECAAFWRDYCDPGTGLAAALQARFDVRAINPNCHLFVAGVKRIQHVPTFERSGQTVIGYAGPDELLLRLGLPPLKRPAERPRPTPGPFAVEPSQVVPPDDGRWRAVQADVDDVRRKVRELERRPIVPPGELTAQAGRLAEQAQRLDQVGAEVDRVDGDLRQLDANVAELAVQLDGRVRAIEQTRERAPKLTPRPDPVSTPPADHSARNADQTNPAAKAGEIVDKAAGVAARVPWEGLLPLLGFGGPAAVIAGGAIWLLRRKVADGTARRAADHSARSSVQTANVVTVENPPPPQAVYPTTQFTPVEIDRFAQSFSWAMGELGRKEPGAIGTLETLRSLIDQHLAGSRRKG